MEETENFKEPSLKEKTAKGLFWGGFSNVIQQALGAAFGIFIARILSPDDYGLVGMLAIFTVFANIILESGFTSALINEKEIRHKDYNAVFWFSLTAGICLYIILFFAAPLISHFFNNPLLTDLSRVLFLSFLINSAGTAHHAIMLKKLMVKERAIIDITTIFFSGLTGLTLALNGFAYWGLVVQQLLQAGIPVMMKWYYSAWRPTWNINFGPIRRMFGYSFKLLLTNIFICIGGNIFSVVFGKLYTEKEVGLYTQGAKWNSLVSSIVEKMISGVAQPVFVEARDDRERQCNIFRKMLRFAAFCSFPVMLGLAFVGKEFILISLGAKWRESVPFLQLLCIWGAGSTFWALYVYVLWSYGKSNIYLYGNLVVLALQILVVATLFRLGIFPMIFGYVLTWYIGLAIWHYAVSKLTGLTLWQALKDVVPFLAIAAASIGIAWLVTRGIENIYLCFALKVVITAVLYFLIMRLSGSKIYSESMSFLKSVK
jgi:O-antigen/teichoic acid export membrane protein